ncbi:class I adenylate-forming enzyme family protein [Pseudomonas sp. 148P]|uniref:Class I adenylate-forming enzyme family protein n=1 Tax=Pseudomonas ulcerans TaxID=3115852 RepID=A0ABU7HNH5_9PSED|nr:MULTISPECIES: class I adenylate-forming enzyme family protein [unclassified Pseudomonas]MEE1926436.1 class I adenylate-forming enzyme family protein [Pseudomonas sp. 147P]MEE1933085.1 class I adenylate-forming enzyme family protein [Pseudomonas sp. 148P]
MKRPGGMRQVLDQCNGLYPGKTAIVYAGESYTYAQLDDASQRLAAGLRGVGLRQQENVLLCLGNRIEMVCAFWGVLKAGGVVVNVDPLVRRAHLEHVLRDCEASVFITTSAVLAGLPSSIASLPHLRAIVLLDGEPDARATRTFESLLGQEDLAATPLSVQEDDLAAIFYPDEGPQLPRGVMVSQRNMLAALDSLRSNLAYEVTDNILCSLPLSTDYGLYQMLMAVDAGATLVLEKTSNAALSLMDSIERHQVSVVPFVTNTLTFLYEHATRRGIAFPGVRLVTNGGAGLRRRQISRMNSLFPNARICTLFGLPECKCCACLPPEDVLGKPGSIGIAVPDTEVWLIDDEGQRVEQPQRLGQLVIRSASMTPGYWRDPVATAQRLKPGIEPGEVVLHTGVLCSRDEDGYLYHHGSVHQLIRCDGMRVNPLDIEQFLLALDGVRDAAVVGIADAERGQAPWAFVVVEPNQRTADVGELLEHCRSGLASWQVPVGITFKTILPSTGSGRVDLVLLQEWARNEQAAVAE